MKIQRTKKGRGRRGRKQKEEVQGRSKKKRGGADGRDYRSPKIVFQQKKACVLSLYQTLRPFCGRWGGRHLG